MIPALLTSFSVLLLSSTPIFIALGLSAFIAVMIFSDIPTMILVQRLFGGIDQFALMSLPFFLLAANLMDIGGLSERILAWARTLVGHIHGGPAMTTQVSSMFFGAVSGSSPATVVAIGKVMYPELIRSKYPPHFAAGLLASAGSVSLIIPPSITFIVYGAVSGASVGKLFMAGIGAGIVYGASALVYIYIYARKRNLPTDKKAGFKAILSATKDAGWALAISVIILGGIYSGIVTPTEAAGISAIYALIVGMFIYKELTWKEVFNACKASAITTGQVLVLVAAAQLLGWLLTMGQLPQLLTNLVMSNISSPIVFLLALNLVLLIMGMFMEGTAAILILTPLLYPIAMQLGIDPIHLGVIMVTNLAMGMYTPPFGINLFVAGSVTDLKIGEIIPGIVGFLIVNIIAIIIITYFPQVSLFLPNLLG